MDRMEALLTAMADQHQAQQRQEQGLECLIGLLLAYAQGCQGFDAADLEALLSAQQEGFLQNDLHDPFLKPFERLAAMLRALQGQPVGLADLPIEARKGYPLPELAVLQRWRAVRSERGLE